MKHKEDEEVLVRAKVTEDCEDGGDVRLHIKRDDGEVWVGWSPPSSIYSKAPPFEIGEEIEVRHNDEIKWRQRFFRGFIEAEEPYFCSVEKNDCCIVGWNDARKIEPKDKPLTIEELVEWQRQYDKADNKRIDELVREFAGRTIAKENDD